MRSDQNKLNQFSKRTRQLGKWIVVYHTVLTEQAACTTFVINNTADQIRKHCIVFDSGSAVPQGKHDSSCQEDASIL